jgi:hypothetical protein
LKGLFEGVIIIGGLGGSGFILLEESEIETFDKDRMVSITA